MKIDGDRVRAAILDAERGTNATIAVHVAHHRVEDVLDHAKRQFHKAKLHEHPAGNGVVIDVAPRSRKVAVVGGKAIHERVGDAFWKQVVDEMTPFFAEDRPTDALVHGIELIAKELRAHAAPEAAQ